ncbi:MAG: hypothetical protein R6V56_04750 [Lentisphaeria bacterium]
MIQTITIEFADGNRLKWDFDFSLQGTMQMDTLFLQGVPKWMELAYCQCPACTLSTTSNPTCPVAEALGRYLHKLAHHNSYDQVKVEVFTDDGCKTVIDSIALQNVVSELVRLAVFQYECPIGRQVKPAMTTLPPFPSNEDILNAFALTFAQSLDQDCNIPSAAQSKIMEDLHDLLGNLCVRLESVGEGDAQLNGIVILHSLATLFTLSAPELIADVRGLDNFRPQSTNSTK